MKRKLLSIGLSLILVLIFSGCGSSGDLYRNGKKSFESGNYEDALSYFTAAKEKKPGRADYYIDGGMALIKLGRYEEALAEFDKAYVNKDIIIVNRNNKRIHRGKGIAYYFMLEYGKAMEEFRKALEINELSKMDMDILYYVGSSLMALGSYEEAIQNYTDLIKLDAKSANAYSSRALCYGFLGDADKSRADYDEAIRLEPGNYAHYLGKYYLLMENGEEQAAAEVLKTASAIEVKTSADGYNLAKIHFYQGDYELSLSEFSEGFKNGFKEAYYYIGEIYRIQKDYPKAIYYYDIFIKDGGAAVPGAYNQLAACYIKTGEYASALQCLEQGIALNQAGSMQILMKNLIVAYEYLGRFEDAGKNLNWYLSLYPGDEEAAREARFLETRRMEAVIENGAE